MIRETKKNDIVNSVLGSSSDSTKKYSVIPGRPTVIKIPLENNSHLREVFTITVRDPDQEVLEDTDKNGKVISQRIEFKMPKSTEELTNLVKQGKISRPPHDKWDLVTRSGEVCLDAN